MRSPGLILVHRHEGGLTEERVGPLGQIRHFPDVIGGVGEIRAVGDFFPRRLNQELAGQILGPGAAIGPVGAHDGLHAERRQRVSASDRRRFNIGCNGNPVFPEMFRRPATACGGSLLAAAELLAGRTVFSPAGGTHHGRPDRASGFCYFNDPVLAILALLDGGLERVLYLDVDAHHGDGVQDAFADDPRVLTLSIHENGRWPMRPNAGHGRLSDRGGGTARNLPVPPGLNDGELALLAEEVVWPLAEDFAPDALVLQCGADGLEDDPQSKLCLSNRAYWRLVEQAWWSADRLLVLGGGGYNPWSVARCWTGIWAKLRGLEPPDRLPPEAEAVLRALSWRHSRGRNPPERWFTSLCDPPNDGPVRDEIRALAEEAKALS